MDDTIGIKPLVDFHVHLEGDMTLEKAIKLSEMRNVKFGVVEHGGVGQPIDGDDALKRYIERLDGYPVYKGMQAEGLDWMSCFSTEVVVQLDYVLSDALTFPDTRGRRIRLWEPDVKIKDTQDFMDRYVDFNVSVISREPIDILANSTFIPYCISNEYDAVWTETRMKSVIDAAATHEVAIEINSRYRIPNASFIQMAKKAGVRFSFGSNYHDDNIGRLDYCLEMVKALSSEEKRLLICVALRELYGERLDKDVPLLDEQKTLFAFLVPPGERFRLHLLENPQLAEELKRRSQAPAKTRLSDLIQRLKTEYP